MSIDPGLDDPSLQAVTWGRAWLCLVGGIWLAAGMAVFAYWSSEVPWGAVALIAMALFHFVVARFGSRRIAVLFAVLGP